MTTCDPFDPVSNTTSFDFMNIVQVCVEEIEVFSVCLNPDITGPKETPYEDGRFFLDINITTE